MNIPFLLKGLFLIALILFSKIGGVGVFVFFNFMMTVFNELSQEGYQFREDDGVESSSESNGGATDIALKNVDVSFISSRKFRLRFLVKVAANRSIPGFSIHQSHNGGAFTQVTLVSSVARIVDTTFYIDGDDATEYIGRIGIGVWTNIINGQLMEADGGSSDSLTEAFSMIANTEMEVEITLELQPGDLSTTNTIRHQLRRSTSTSFSNGYPQVPIITIVDAPTVTTDAVSLINTDKNLSKCRLFKNRAEHSGT